MALTLLYEYKAPARRRIESHTIRRKPQSGMRYLPRFYCLAASTFLMSTLACTKTHKVIREMSWSDRSKPYPYRPLPTGAVRLTFVAAPHTHIGIEAPGVQEHLRASGKDKVLVEFDVACHSGQVRWFRTLSVDGQSVINVLHDAWMETVDAHDLEAPFGSACE
jgi:hypothetical protein